jgi:esterase/lipase superfamily enzyme
VGNPKTVREEYFKWHSPSLNREIGMLVFGERGLPIIVFPTSMGMHNENKDFKLIDSASWFIENGFVKIYCPDSVDKLSWYNETVHPSVRAYNHTVYDQMLHTELVPKMKQDTGFHKIATAGCSFGGYQAANYAFRHPENVSHLMSMGAAFDIRRRVEGYYDDNVYFNNPVDYISGSNDANLWNMKIVLGTAEGDMCKGSNEQMSYLLNNKGIKHWLDVRPWGGHDWPIWREMFPQYLSLL